MDAFEQLRQSQQSQNTGKGKAVGGALGAMLGGFGIKLRDAEGFSTAPGGVFTQDVDMMNLFRKTKAGEELVKAQAELKQAADGIKIHLAEDGDGFQGSGLARKTSAPDTMER